MFQNKDYEKEKRDKENTEKEIKRLIAIIEREEREKDGKFKRKKREKQPFDLMVSREKINKITAKEKYSNDKYNPNYNFNKRST